MEAGEIWLRDNKNNVLYRLIMHCHLEDSTLFSILEGRKTLIKGQGPAGYIWNTHEPIALKGAAATKLLTEAGGYNHSEQWNNILGFPILFENDLLGSVILLSPHHQSNTLLNAVTNVSAQLGNFIKRKQTEEQIVHLKEYDELTGLFNRDFFEKQLMSSIKKFADNEKSRFTLLLINIDEFGEINNNFGYESGDTILKIVAERIKNNVSVDDVVARFEGDSFAVIKKYVDTPESVMILARSLQEKISEPITFNHQTFTLTASIGATLFPEDGKDVQHLLKNVTISMRRAKELGRNEFQFYQLYMTDRVRTRMYLEQSIRHALELQEFSLFYQPKIDLKNKRIAGVEALIRWQKKDSMVMPSDFIPLAEDVGLIVPIGEFVLLTACHQNKYWQNGKIIPPFPISVNLSMRQFNDPKLVDKIKGILKETSLSPSCLELELTETIIMQNIEYSAKILNVLKELGILLSIDDFGTGYSSFKYLMEFTVDTLKIDQYFVKNLSDPKAYNIVSAIIAMAKNMGVRVVAEGVETKAQLNKLIECECDEVQGYLFSRPLPSEAMNSFLTMRSKGLEF